MDLITGLLGFAKGAAGAVETLSDENRKALAESLRLKVLEQMDIRAEKRRQDFTTSEREAGQGFLAKENLLNREARVGTSEAGMTSRENIAGNRLAHDQKVAEDNETWRTKDIGVRTEANRLKAQTNRGKAWSEVGKVTKDSLGAITPENVDTVNGILASGGVGAHYTSETIPGKEGGFFGRGGRDEVTTFELVPDDPGTAGVQAPGKGGLEDGASENLKGLLEEAESMGDSKQKPVKVPDSEDKGQDPHGESMTQTGPPDIDEGVERPAQGKGFLQDKDLGSEPAGEEKETSALAKKYKDWVITVDNDGTIRLLAPNGTRTYMKKPSQTRQARAPAKAMGPGRRGKPTLIETENPKYVEYMKLLAFAQSQ